MPKPNLADVPEFYHKYVAQIQDDNVNDALQNNTENVLSLLQSLPSEKWSYRYAEGKWSIKEVLQHLTDAERIFSYRALCFARGEPLSLPGFDENTYAAASKADERTSDHLLAEFEAVRKSTALLFAMFDKQQLAATGVANNNPISVNAIGFIIPGHAQHHLNILQDRYL